MPSLSKFSYSKQLSAYLFGSLIQERVAEIWRRLWLIDGSKKPLITNIFSETRWPFNFVCVALAMLGN